jgi:U3 small nucleolar RNA-associated protein 10
MQAFDRRTSLCTWKADAAEEQTIATFLELVTKLNESSFRPLFRKVFDWAFAQNDNGTSTLANSAF